MNRNPMANCAYVYNEHHVRHKRCSNNIGQSLSKFEDPPQSDMVWPKHATLILAHAMVAVAVPV